MAMTVWLLRERGKYVINTKLYKTGRTVFGYNSNSFKMLRCILLYAYSRACSRTNCK